jgi:hypothetical protein
MRGIQIRSIMVFLLPAFLCRAQLPLDTARLRSEIKSAAEYPFIRNELNYIEYFDATAVSALFEKLKRADREKVRILHMGDSHLQADIGANHTRNSLQAIFGFGGRGSVFPYAAAGTHATQDYNSFCSGSWEKASNLQPKPRFPVGVSGFTVKTRDSMASFGFRFYQNNACFQPHFRFLSVYCEKGDSCFDLECSIDAETWYPVQESALPEDRKLSLLLPEAPLRELRFRFRKNQSQQRFAQIYGLSLESTENRGVLYHSTGINGARLNAIKRAEIFQNQLREYQPDAVFIDLIANDLAFGGFDSVFLSRELDTILARIRAVRPETSILLIGMQDISVRGRNIENAGYYSRFIRQYAGRNRVAFYDYFRVSGGRHSIKKWHKNKLCNNDLCHLTRTGYLLKGRLLTNAILGSYLHFLGSEKPLLSGEPTEQPMMEEKQEIPGKQLVGERIQVPVPEKEKEPAALRQKKGKKPVTTRKKIHVVRKGDTLYALALRHKTTVKKIMAANRLKSDKLALEQKLLIP